MSVHKRTHVNLKRAKSFSVGMIMAVLVVLLSGCATRADAPSAAATEQPTEDLEVTLDIERFATPQEAEMNHFVSAVDDELFIGIAVSAQNVSGQEPRTVAVYLCDSQDVSQWIFEEIVGQEATLHADDTSVEVTITDDRVTGMVALGNEEPQPFTAELATGSAGLYRATYRQGGVDHHLDWIVLADGRRRGPLDGKGNDIYPPPPLN